MLPATLQPRSRRLLLPDPALSYTRGAHTRTVRVFVRVLQKAAWRFTLLPLRQRKTRDCGTCTFQQQAGAETKARVRERHQPHLLPRSVARQLRGIHGSVTSLSGTPRIGDSTLFLYTDDECHFSRTTTAGAIRKHTAQHTRPNPRGARAELGRLG